MCVIRKFALLCHMIWHSIVLTGLHGCMYKTYQICAIVYMKVDGLPAWIGPSPRIRKSSILCHVMHNGLPIAMIGVRSPRYPYNTHQICVIVCYKLIWTFTNVNRSLSPHPLLLEEIVKTLYKL